eukprot:31431-Pelagococcus_subviridis.AAC.3
MHTSIVECSRTTHWSPKSTTTWSRMMDVAATFSPSPATTTPRFKTSYSTERPRTSAASANPIGFSAPSTSHTNRAL